MTDEPVKRLRSRREAEMICGYEHIEWEDGDALEAADTIEWLTAELAEARHRARWNVEPDGDDLLVCFGDHEKSEKCEYIRFTRCT